jgi:purine-nucleoside/S-methyl-5'-thioadenosine phosphorylase / adenosine deaminase
MTRSPALERADHDGIGVLRDAEARRGGVLVAFLNRTGGVSRAPFDSLNLAVRGGDERADVVTNRARAAAAVGFDIADLVLARQVHGADLLEVPRGSSGVLGRADGLVTRVPGPVLGLLSADCAPIVLAGDASVAVLHGGWRGLAAGIVERGVAAVDRARRAWVGPTIRACCYEVGPEVVDAFRRRGLPVDGERRVDPARAAAAVLEKAGIQVAVSDVCTACDPSYFSYRRDGTTGRQGAFAALLST